MEINARDRKNEKLKDPAFWVAYISDSKPPMEGRVMGYKQRQKYSGKAEGRRGNNLGRWNLSWALEG